MGIHDREYYREDSSGSGWLFGTAPAVKAILGVNIGMFVLALVVPDKERFLGLLVATSHEIFHGQVWRLITATFVHNPLALFGLVMGMLFLWTVGRELEAFYGKVEFLWLYLSAAALSTLGWAVVDAIAVRDGATPSFLMGAAGPLMCIITLYTLYNPRREISLFFVVTLEMRLVLAIYVAFMVIPILVSPSGAAVRGFSSQLVGLGYAFAFRGLDLRLGRLKQLWPGRIRRFRVVSPPEVTPREKSSPRPASGPIGGASPSWTSPSGANPANIFSGSGRGSSAGGTSTVVVTQEQLEARLDELLVKIAREGKASLTEEETRILEEASRRARSRRSERI